MSKVNSLSTALVGGVGQKLNTCRSVYYSTNDNNHSRSKQYNISISVCSGLGGGNLLQQFEPSSISCDFFISRLVISD